MFLIPLVCILLGGVFDVFDGFLARKLNATSKTGEVLDSLADFLTFCVLPCILLEILLKENIVPLLFPKGNILQLGVILLPLPLLLASAYRLASFSPDSVKNGFYKGVTTPFNGIFLSFSFFFVSKIPVSYSLFFFLCGLVFVQSFLLVGPFYTFSFKAKNAMFYTLGIFIFSFPMLYYFSSPFWGLFFGVGAYYLLSAILAKRKVQ